MQNHWLVWELEKRHELGEIKDKKLWAQISKILSEKPEIFHDILANWKEKEWIWFTEISQSYFSIPDDLEFSDSGYFYENINNSLPELENLYPNISEKIKQNKSLAFIISSLIDSYRNKELWLIYTPGFHRSLYWPFWSDIFPHVIPFLSEWKDNLNIEYPWNGFVKMWWNVFEKKDGEEFREQFNAEEYEFLVYLFLKFSKNIETIFAHSLWPIFIIEALKKLQNEPNFNEKIWKIIFFNPALNQEKLSKFWFIKNYLDTADKKRLKGNIKKIKIYLKKNKLWGMKEREAILLEWNIQKFLSTLNKKNSNWFNFLELFFDKNWDNFILENYDEWEKWIENINPSYVNYAFFKNFIETYNTLDQQILDKVRMISLEWYSTVPFDSLRNSETDKWVKTMIESLSLETHYWNTADEVKVLRRIFERI